jgi:uncharacterized protein YjiS (DUF1127 family)
MAALAHPFRSLGAAWRGWRGRAHLRAELRALDASDALDSMLADVGLTRAQVPALLASDPQAADLLHRMMRRMRIDPAKSAFLPGLRDIEWTCTTCQAQRRCRAWLDASTPGHPSFCANAAALRHLSRIAVGSRA